MRSPPSRDTARRRNPLHSDSSTLTVEGGHALPTSRRRGVLPALDPLGLLEPGAVKVARRVLRGSRGSNAPGLPDHCRHRSSPDPNGTERSLSRGPSSATIPTVLRLLGLQLS